MKKMNGMIKLTNYTIEKQEIKGKYRKIIKILKSLKGRFLSVNKFGLIYYNENMDFALRIRNFLKDIKLIQGMEWWYEYNESN